MQFLVKAFDGTDEAAPQRRADAREEHLKSTDEMVKAGHTICAAAMLDEEGKAFGSVLIVDYSSKEELDQWLKVEPYMIHNVWQKLEITQCRLAPMLAKK